MQTTAIQASSYPVSAEEVIKFCKLDSSCTQQVEELLIPAILDLVESETGRPMARRQYVEHFDRWPELGRLNLSRGPVCELEKLEQTDEDGCWQELDLTNYEIHRHSQSPWLQLKCNQCECRVCHCGCQPRLRVTYTAGPDKCEISAASKLLILQMICTANANRLSDSETNLKQTPIFSRLINSLKRPRLI